MKIACLIPTLGAPPSFFKITTLVLFITVSLTIEAAQYHPINTTFPTTNLHGPKQFSNSYDITTPIDNEKAVITLTIDYAEGCQLFIFGQKKAKVQFLESSIILRELVPDRNPFLAEARAGTLYHCNQLPPGEHLIELSELRGDKLDIKVRLKSSPLTITAFTSPMTGKAKTWLTTQLTIQDEYPPKSVQAKLLGRHQMVHFTRQNAEHYQARFKAPEVLEPTHLPLDIHIEGIRHDLSPFKRHLKLTAIVVPNTSKVLDKIESDEYGNISLLTTKLTGHYRVDIYYGKGNQSIAWGREEFLLDEESTTLTLQRPPFAQASEKALIKLINLSSLSIEEQHLVQLPELNNPEHLQVLPAPIPPPLP